MSMPMPLFSEEVFTPSLSLVKYHVSAYTTRPAPRVYCAPRVKTSLVYSAVLLTVD